MRGLFSVTVSAILLLGCLGQNSESIPYGLTGFRIYLYDRSKAPDADYLVGTIQCNYRERDRGLAEARQLAKTTATRLGFDTGTDRYYILCTVTSNSDCATKVR